MQVIVPPPVEPVTVEQAFEELRLDPGDDITDAPGYGEIVDLIRDARRHCENKAGRAFVRQTIRFSPDRPEKGWAGLKAIELPRRPFQSIVSVSYYGIDNTLTAIDPENYYSPELYVPAVHFVSGFGVPSLYDRPDALRIDYVAGYPPLPGADPDDPQYLASGVPEEFRRAIRLTMRLLYQSLDPALHKRTEEARDSLLNDSPEKVWSV